MTTRAQLDHDIEVEGRALLLALHNLTHRIGDLTEKVAQTIEDFENKVTSK